MSKADGYVIPKPGVPKTLGILNIIFGVLLVLAGLCQIGSLLAAPAFMNFAEKTVKDVQAKAEAQRKEAIKGLDERAAAAKTDEEKKQIEQERDVLEKTKVETPTMDLSEATEILKDPTILTFNYVSLGTGLILHILLIASGVGLIRLTPWGRSLGVTWAGLAIADLVILTIVNIAFVLPISQAANEKVIAKLEVQAKEKGPGSIEASQVQMTKVMAPLAVPMAVGTAVALMIYPVIALILLNTAGARAACLPKAADEFEA